MPEPLPYLRPLLQTGALRPADALGLAGGWTWFTHVEVLRRGQPGHILPATALPGAALAPYLAPRPDFASLTLDRPRIMGILNVTPDSFSDGGRFAALEAARDAGLALARHADIVDIGGESTRPGATPVPAREEISRTAPAIAALREAGVSLPISIDTRKAEVAQAALKAGATIVNDVSALSYDPQMADLLSAQAAPVILMHAHGAPDTMQDDPRYDDVLLDVYDALTARVTLAERAGIDRSRIVIDPGIGFGKTVAHNLALLRGISLFHGLGLPILVGASRKRFIGTLADKPDPAQRGPGSLAVALAAMAQGVHILRVHDAAETAQARILWQSVTTGETR